MKKKVLILQTSIFKYRVSIFNKLANDYDLTVTYVYKDDSPENSLYARKHISEIKIGPFLFHNIRSLCKQNDVVIYLPSLNRVCFWLVPLLPHHYKTVCMSIGMRASYTRLLDINRPKHLLDKLFGYVQFKADAVLVYFKETLAFWNLKEEVLKKCFQTRNTTDVICCDTDNVKKDSILFVGTLYKEKKVDELILSYKKAFEKIGGRDFPQLEIIGKGDQMDVLREMIEKLDLKERVFLRGPIYDEVELMKYHLRAYVSISPNQAGLSVPKSMGYGVPFVTVKDAITGGEILHIRNGINGILMESLSDLSSIIEDVVCNPNKYIEMGKKAKVYYEEEANIKTMVKGFADAIEYALHN